tara:strand:- start:41612 stop:41983 length:372 start_codon:yes stop_codon:yes gene_type:complete
MKNKYLIHDYLNKFPLDNPYSSRQHGEFPKLKQIIISSSVDYKSLKGSKELSMAQFNKNNFIKNNPLSNELLKLFILFSRIFGQFPKLVKARKSVANFNLRQGMDLGIFFTLRYSSYKLLIFN